MSGHRDQHKNKNSSNTASVVWKFSEPFARDLGLSIWDVRFLKEGALWYLRIFIDRPEGVTLDDCEAFSRAINDPIDQLDPIKQEYCLEVCSPGIDRELSRPEHFSAYLGAVVSVKLFRPLPDGSKDILAILQDFKDAVLTLETQDGQVLEIPKKDTASVRLCDDYVDADELSDDDMEV